MTPKAIPVLDCVLSDFLTVRNVNFYLVKATVFGSYLLYTAKPVQIGIYDDFTSLVPGMRGGVSRKMGICLMIIRKKFLSKQKKTVL